MGVRPSVGWHVLCALLVLRLLTDMATPLMPGAFRFDPAESVDGLRAQPVRAAQAAATRAAGPSSIRVEQAVSRRLLAQRVGTRESDPPRFRRLLARHTPDHAPEAPEDPLIATIPFA